MTMKLLLTQDDASNAEGMGGATLQLLESLTSAKMKISKDGEFYPGTSMRELRINGSSLEGVVNALALALSQVAGDTGIMSGGEANVEPGGARVKLLLPVEAAEALDENGLRQIQNATGVAGRLLPQVLPLGARTEASEQVLYLSGPLQGMKSALSAISAPLGQLTLEAWFPVWASTSHCGLPAPEVDRFNPGAGQQLSLANLGQGGGGRGGGYEGGCGGGYDSSSQVHSSPRNSFQGQSSPQNSLGNGSSGGRSQKIPGGLASLAGRAPTTGPLLMKLLLSTEEAAFLRRNGNAVLQEIRQASGTEFLLVHEGELYPGTSLQEMVVQGQSAEATIAGTIEAFNRIIEAMGLLTVGDQRQEPGTASMKVIIPVKVTSVVIGPGGTNVRQIRDQTKMHVHVESTILPLGLENDSSEQVVSFYGPTESVQTALLLMAEVLMPHTQEPWFPIWGNTSNSGQHIPGLQLFQDAKGKGKGKDGEGGGGRSGGKGFGKGKTLGGLCLKLLVTSGEASCVLGRGGNVVRDISQGTNTRINTSSRSEFYPSTQLQELRISGATQAPELHFTTEHTDSSTGLFSSF
ncbi:unnamed protein product [Polarella glacialis]|uniref:K Homology domain-containing protein n=3 Tax=Polarella glacialis TaxID=89957 RepID=A0A813HSY9_POLGL|nr:unnamed protein product [Polarella glacialis]